MDDGGADRSQHETGLPFPPSPGDRPARTAAALLAAPSPDLCDPDAYLTILSGDLNEGDGDVDFADLNLVISAFNTVC